MASPDGTALRRWVRRRTQRHLRGTWTFVGDVYSVLLTLVVVVAILTPYPCRMVMTPPGSTVGVGTLSGFTTVGLDPEWGFLAPFVLLVTVGVGSLGRLDPPFLCPHEAARWLSMPGDQDSLLVPMARVGYLIAATIGATAGILSAVTAEDGRLAATVQPALTSTGTRPVLTELIRTRILDRDVRRLRRHLIVVGATTFLTGVVITFPRFLFSNTVVALLVGMLAFLIVLGWRRTRSGLGKVHDAALLTVVVRSFGARVSLLSLGTRAPGRLPPPDSAWPVVPSSLRAAQIESQSPRSLGILIAVTQANWILLRRQHRRLFRMEAELIITILPLLSEMVGTPLHAVGCLIGDWVTTLAVAGPARRT